ncbi:hypothetical protein K523DRAFT_159775 [Schizophyllum commune Tattone D]|nr:hypothetical protein K523DRAFT_159775 [Schizophyllum commune Tattone D]
MIYGAPFPHCLTPSSSHMRTTTSTMSGMSAKSGCSFTLSPSGQDMRFTFSFRSEARRQGRGYSSPRNDTLARRLRVNPRSEERASRLHAHRVMRYFYN